MPREWARYRAFDYGLDMFAVLWFATDARGYSYCYREFRQKDLNIPQAQDKFRRENKENVKKVYAPPDMWNRRQDTGRSMAEMFASCGTPLIKASNDRIAGWAAVKEYIEIPVNDAGEKEQPMLQFFDTCGGIIEDMPLLQSDPKKPNDVSTQPHEHTHSPDALRYWCSERHMKSRLTEKKKPDPFNLNRKPKRVVNDYLMKGYN